MNMAKKESGEKFVSQRKATFYLRILYPTWTIVGMFSIIYVRSKIFVPGDAAATANNIVANEALFRFGIVGILVTQLFYVAVALLLYKLFKKVNKDMISLLLVLALLAVPIAMFNAINQLATLTLLNGGDYLQAFSQAQLQALTTFFLEIDRLGEMIATIFWGLWLLPLGFLVKKSGWFPRVIGLFLYLAAFGYLLDAFTHFLAPDKLALTSPFVSILTMGELLYMIWFVFVGPKIPETKN